MTASGKRPPITVSIRSELQSCALRPASVLRITLFGSMTVTDIGGRDLLPKHRKSRAVLAVLALSLSRPVLRSTLTKLLWSRRDAEQARASLRQSVHEISGLLSNLPVPLLKADRTSLALSHDAIWVDALEVARSTLHQPDSLALLSGGPFLNDLAGLDEAFDEWIAAEQARLTRAAVLSAEAALMLCNVESAPPPVVASAAQRLMAIDPANQAGCRALVTALAASGDRAGAVAAYARCEAALAKDVGTAPSAETRAALDGIRLMLSPRAPVEARGRSPRGVCLGVMPFRLLDGPSREGFSVGLAEDITAALSRFRWFFLIASPSLAAVQAAPSAERPALLQDLKLDFLLDGTIQSVGGRVRVIVRLLDMRQQHAHGPEIAWSQRFDGTDADMLTLQDRIAAETVAQVDPELLMREGRLAATRAARDITAYDLTMRAIPAIYSLDEMSFRRAGDQLEAAIARDPQYATAHAWAAYWEIFLFGQGWAGDPAATMRRAGSLAERAIALDPADARALTIAGHVRAYLERRAEAAHVFHEQALQLNPNLPLAWALSGLALSYDGEHVEAIRRTAEAHRLSPLDPHHFLFDGCEMVPNLLLGNHERVVDLARRATALNPKLLSNYKVYLSALGHLGAAVECEAVRARLHALEPEFRIRAAEARTPLRRPADRDHYVQGLRLAGLPE